MSKQYEKLWEALIPDRHDLLYKEAPLDNPELASLVGYLVQKEYLEKELKCTPKQIRASSHTLNSIFAGNRENNTAKDLRVIGYKHNDNWYRTLIPVNGRKAGLKRYLNKFDQKEKIKNIEKASSWSEDQSFKEVTSKVHTHNIVAEVSSFFRQKINGQKIKFKKLVYDTKEKIVGKDQQE